MLTMIRKITAVGAVIALLLALGLSSNSLFAQSATPAPASGSMPAGDQTGMTDMATPAANASMDQMMAQCMAMMMGMMGDGGMDQMMDMMATPGAGMSGMMDMMATPGAGMDDMGTPVSGT